MGGYRMTADDIYFQNVAFGGVHGIFESAQQFAISQGRIGQYVSVPLIILGSYLADIFWVRALYVALYFLLFFLVSRYVAKLLKADVTLFLFALMVSLTNIGPQIYNHLPPTAYPLLISIPLLIIISLKLWKQNWLYNRVALNPLRQMMYAFLMIFAMLINEFAFLFGTGLLLLQWSSALSRSVGFEKEKKDGQLKLNIKDYHIESVTIALVLSIYAIFRLTFPSSYSGNTPDGLLNISAIFYTLTGHILSGTSLPLLIDWHTQIVSISSPRQLIETATNGQILIALMFGVMTAYLIFTLTIKTLPQIRYLWAIGGAVLFAIYVTLPTAVTQKYQLWCASHNCVYIDTRISYYGLIIAAGLGALMILTKSRGSFIQSWLRMVFALLIGAMASHTYLNNELLRETMKEYTQAWDRAQQYICAPNAAPENDKNLLHTLDPKGLIQYHGQFPIMPYWINYMHYYQSYRHC